MSSSETRTGAEVLLADPTLVDADRLGLVTNHTGVTSELVSTPSALKRAGVPLTALFAPEHGLRGTAQAGESDSPERDPETDLPVYDTYTRVGSELDDLIRASGVRALLFDLQDIGSRFYTYVWTMYDLMVSAARCDVRFVVLDRPNPLGGVLVEGPLSDERFASFVGRTPIPVRHGLTSGELARHLNATAVPSAAGRAVDLLVVRAERWSRTAWWEDTGMPWVMPSVNIPTPESALAYPGTGLFEGTNLSEGRGTTRPFELIGAPYVDRRWVRALNAAGLPGVRFRDVSFRPTFHKHADTTVHGVQLHVTDRERFRPVRTAVRMIGLLRSLYPDEFGWRVTESGAENTAHRHVVDLLWGSDRLRRCVDAGDDPLGLLAGAPERVQDWVAPDALLYE